MNIPEPKKRKISQRSTEASCKTACTVCRKRKVRCDAAQPSCSYCAIHGKDCVYSAPFVRAQCSQSYVFPFRLPIGIALLEGLNANDLPDMLRHLKLG